MLLNPDQARRLAGLLLEDEAEAPEPGAALGGRSFGNYRVSRLVGVGGMGEVYEAQQDKTGRRVAIKVIRSELISADLHRRFEHEVRVLARLQHPGIAQVYEAGRVETTSGNTPYFAMEFVEGRTLTKYAADQNLSIRDRLDLFLKICDAVEHAHRKGVIHRDLKPANILVDASGQPRILDFGVARATDADIQATTLHTDIGRIIGTLPYMSPEQISGDPDALDTRSDVYSLGVILYELLAGKPPYELSRGRMHEAARVIREVEPARLGILDPKYKGDLETIVGKAMQKDREPRYASVGDFAGDLRRYLSGDAISARAPSLPYQLRKLAARHKPAVYAAAIVAVTLVAGAAVSSWFAFKEASARRQADQSAANASRQAKSSAAVVSFLERTLSSPDPNRIGRDARVVDMLSSAESDIDDAAAGDPAAGAAVLTAIGSAYLGLGDAASAEATLRRAVKFWQDAGLFSSPDALQTRGLLGVALSHLARPDEASIMLIAVLEDATTVLGPNHTDTISTLNDLALATLDLGDTKTAEQYARKALELRRALGGDPSEYYTSLDTLANVLHIEGKMEEAEKLFEEAFNGLKAKLGEDNPQAVTEENNYGMFLNTIHKYQQAEPLLRDALERRMRILGDSNPRTYTTMHNLGVVLRSLKKNEEAEAMVRGALDGRKRLLGPNHPHTFLSMQTLALLINDRGGVDEATELTRDVLARRRHVLGERSDETLSSARLLGDMYRKAGRNDQAVAAYDEAERLALLVTGEQSLEFARLLGMQGDCLVKSGQNERATETLLRAESIADQVPEAARLLPLIRKDLADAYTAMGQNDKAAIYREKAQAAVQGAPRPDK